MAESNFEQFDPTKNNIQGDAAYLASNYRISGCRTGVAPSATHNKLFYQLSTFISAFAGMMAEKGYEMSDADISILQTELSNIMTSADMSVYALVSSLVNYLPKEAVVIKTSSYVILPSDFYKTIEANSASDISFTLPLYTDVANGAFVKIKNISTGTLTLNGTIDGETNPDLSQWEEITVFSDGTALRGKVIAAGGTDGLVNSLSENGYQEILGSTGTLIIQWGKYDASLGEGEVNIVFPKSFPTNCLNVTATGIGAGSSADNSWMQVKTISAAGATLYCQHTFEGGGLEGFFWQAIGY